MKTDAGMTLIEVLVAVALLAIMSVLAFRGLDGAQRSANRLSDATERWQEVARALDRLCDDLMALQARPRRNGPGLEPALDGGGVESGPYLLALSRHSPVSGSREQRFAYRVREGRLELIQWPTVDALAANPPYLLLRGVRHLDVSYMDDGGQWLTHWPPQAGNPASGRLPRAVMIRMTLEDIGELVRIVALP